MKHPLPLLFLTIAFAGCVQSDADSEGDGDTPPDPLAGMPPLHGWVFDAAVAPLSGVEIQASAGNALLTATTDADGFYGFNELPTGEPVILIARAEGFEAQSKQTTLVTDRITQLNFTMVALPVIQPYSQELGPFNGVIACQYRTELNEQKNSNECGLASNENQWQFTVDKDFAGAVVEINWDANTLASQYLQATVECATPAACGDNIPIFAEAIGPSTLRMEISNLAATKYFPDGGLMLLTVFVDPNNDANEVAVGAAFAVQQQFQAIVSAFYHAPPPPGYTITE